MNRLLQNSWRAMVAAMVIAACSSDGSFPPTTFTLKPAGDTLTLLGGLVTVESPAGAVTQNSEITAMSATVFPASAVLVDGSAVDMVPDGLVFQATVTIRINYALLALPSGVQGQDLRVATVVNGAWQVIPGSTVDLARTEVVAPIQHLSTYGLVTAPVGSVSVAPLTPSVAVATTAQPTATPILLEEFRNYTSARSMLSDPNHLYSTSEDLSTGQMTLSQLGYGTSPNAMTFTYPNRTNDASRCNEYTIGRNIQLAQPQTEIWLEVVAKFSAGFKTAAPSWWACASNPDFKFLVGRVTPSSRFVFAVGGYPTEDGTSVGYPSNEEPPSPVLAPAMVFDGQWHVYRFHWKAGLNGTGACKMWRDGVVFADQPNVSTPANTTIYGISLGRGMNQGPAVAGQTLSFGKIAVFTSDPGW